ncbi:hypothetical protein MPSI1_003154 [Malassezia psittaci]|uniref:Uncharacterized protein n=1 Tax=Malassezia psittaci TaxID=1821823 RepID=A0AAF0FE13_9BASI|nr:hypothetical protein MPSI1_003154 [Malassezia psittaci]
MSTDHSPFRGDTCWNDTFTAYHDPNTEILMTCIFGIFALVFFYYFLTRRPKFEYFLLLVFCALEVGSFVMRIYGVISDAIIGMIVYTAGVAFSLCVLYSLYARWTKIADQYHGRRIFNLVMFHPAFPILFAILIICTIIAGVWVPTIMWVVFLALTLALWVTCLVALIRHRRHRPQDREKTIVMSQMDSQFKNTTPIVTSHKTLDNMMVMLVVLTTIVLVKTIYLTIAFVLVLLWFVTPFFYIFCLLEDFAYIIILISPEAVQLFEPTRHVPEMRSEIGQGKNNDFSLSQRYGGEQGALAHARDGENSNLQQSNDHHIISMPQSNQMQSNPQYSGASNNAGLHLPQQQVSSTQAHIQQSQPTAY